MEKLSTSPEADKESLAKISGRTLDDISLWVRRDVVEPSVVDINSAQSMFWRDQAIPRLGVFTMSRLYPREIKRAARQAESSGAGLQVGRFELIEHLNQIMPPSLKKPVEAEVRGLGQFYNKIGMVLHYEEAEEERAVLTEGLNQILGVEYDWSENTSHTTIARGLLGRISNRQEIEKALPDSIHLSVAQKLED